MGNALYCLVLNNPPGPKKVLIYRKTSVAHEESSTGHTQHLPLLCSVTAYTDSPPKKPPTIYLLRKRRSWRAGLAAEAGDLFGSQHPDCEAHDCTELQLLGNLMCLHTHVHIHIKHHKNTILRRWEWWLFMPIKPYISKIREKWEVYRYVSFFFPLIPISLPTFQHGFSASPLWMCL